jgi:2-hydroxy-4-carboxymuconate semialdehyde hemiacetal dehydrogenase
MKPLRAAILGYGAVASIHARSLAAMEDARPTVVFGPDAEKARVFASQCGVEESTSDLGTVGSRADLVIVCSPTHDHFQQTRFCLQAGLPVLVELPPCEKLQEAIELGEIADRAGLLIQCAHTSRYIEPYKIMRNHLQNLGTIQQVNYLRNHVARPRSWIDDPVLHHAAHPLDLMIDWFGGVNAVAQVSFPRGEISESVSLLGCLPNGAPLSISICYRSQLLVHRLTVVGTDHACEASAFSHLHSDLPALAFQGNDQRVYEAAIAEQDREFVAACRGKESGTRWSETITLMKTISEFQNLRPGCADMSPV